MNNDTSNQLPATSSNTGLDPNAVLDLSRRINKLQAFLAIDLALFKEPFAPILLQVGSNGPRVAISKDDIESWLNDAIALQVDELEKAGLNTATLLQPFSDALTSLASQQQRK